MENVFFNLWTSIRTAIEGFFSSIDLTQHPFYLIDILVVAVTFYYVYVLIRGTRAVPILTGLIILAVVSFITTKFQLSAVNWILGHFFTLIVIAIPVVFRDELRRGLETIGQTRFFKPKHEGRGMQKTIRAIVDACEALSTSKTGGLIIIKRDVNLSEVIETGIVINADISAELLLTIFFTGSPLHDGAVIVDGNKVIAASCVLPLSIKQRDTTLGTRHKAALGISEHTDAIAIIVSEEKGKIAIANNGVLTGNLDFDQLESILTKTIGPKLPVSHKHGRPMQHTNR